MAVHGILRPSVPGRHSLAVLTQVLAAFRLQSYRSLLRLVTPTRRRHYPPPTLFATRPTATHTVVKQNPVQPEKTRQRLLDGNVVPYRKGSLSQTFCAEGYLERLCIEPESFHFGDLRHGMASNGDVMVSGEIEGKELRSGSGLCLEEVGRQLGQLALVAVGACDVRRHDTFYVATNAFMEHCHTDCTPDKSKLTGLVRIVRLQAHDAQAEVELWGRDVLICRMSVQYDVFSSWQEVLPNLANTAAQ